MRFVNVSRVSTILCYTVGAQETRKTWLVCVLCELYGKRVVVGLLSVSVSDRLCYAGSLWVRRAYAVIYLSFGVIVEVFVRFTGSVIIPPDRRVCSSTKY